MTTKLINNNKKAFHEYFIEDTYQAGIMLKGSEVKSARQGGVSLSESFVYIKDGEVFLKNCYIKPYEMSSSYTPESHRTRKLLLNRQEIDKLTRKVKEKGYTLVPIKVYFKDNLVKVEIGLARGKKLYDKRETLKEKTIKRDIDNTIKHIKNW